MKRKITKPKIKVEDSSGNVFKDLGFPDAEGHSVKAAIASQIYDLVKKKKLSQAKAGKLLKITQSKVSYLLRGRLCGFSLEKLLKFLNILGQDVEISTSPSSSGAGKLLFKSNVI